MTVIPYHRPRRRRGFLVLTPLVDVVFLLLVFFMLTSQITPYSLLVLGGVGTGAPSAGAPGEAPAVAPMVVRVAHGEVTLGGRRVAIADMPQAARELGERGIDAFLLIPAAAAEVQDVVSVLEALTAAGVASVTLVNSAAGGAESRP